MPRSLSLLPSILFLGLVMSSPLVVSAQEPVSEPMLDSCRVLPPNIVAIPAVRAMVLDLAAMSDTFRQQCALVGRAADVRVRIHLVPRTRVPAARASTEMLRVAPGALFAIVELPIGRDFAELLGHEFEHIVEQIAGLCLRTLARAGNAGVTETGRGAFETERATRVGRQVAAEADDGIRVRRQAHLASRTPTRDVVFNVAVRPRSR
jgi:hypothetical protein